MDGGSGNVWILGFQWDRADFEMGWEQSDHDGTWAGLAFPSEYQSLNFDGSYNWGNKVRPLIVYGLGFNSIRVQDGSTNGFDFEDARFKGMAVRLGGGLHFPLHRRVGIQMQGVYRWGSFGSVDGIVSGEIGDDVDANGMTYTVDARFVFGKKK